MRKCNGRWQVLEGGENEELLFKEYKFYIMQDG